MQDAPILVLADILTLDSMDAFDVDMQLLNQDIQLLRVRQWMRNSFLLRPSSFLQIIPDLLEYPRSSKGGTTNHHRIHPIAFKRLFGLLGSGDITITDNRDMDARVRFHLTNQ